MDGHPLEAAAELLTSGSSLDPDYRTAWGGGQLASATYDGDVISVVVDPSVRTRPGATMGEVVGSIGRVSALVGEISSATSEQSMGVHQVGSAVSQMDGVTQQNAELVGELSSDGAGLKAQAQELVEAMDMFRLKSTGAHTPA